MKFSKLIYSAAAIGMLLTSCSDYEPNGYTEGPNLAVAQDLTATVGGAAGHDVTVTWQLPDDEDMTGCILYRDAKELERFDLNTTGHYSYTALGTPLGKEVMYTVKVTYANNAISTGVSTTVCLPEETFAGVSNLEGSLNGRAVTLTWDLPSQDYRTGVRIITNGESDKAILLPADATSYVMRGQPMEQDLTYSVEVVYDTYYYSPSASISEKIPFMEPRMLYLLPEDAQTYADLQDDDELAAASWFARQPNAYFVHPSEIADYDPSVYSVMWIEVDRLGLPIGWENLPGGLADDATIEALREYSLLGGSLYLANMATQLTVPLDIVPSNMAPTVFGNGEGGTGTDYWVINPNLGWDFRNGADQGFYDRTTHAIFQGLTLEDPNGYGYPNLPLIGPGQREDHNCLWDCNIYGKGSFPDVIRAFEDTTNSLVLATWGHVRDHCVAGLVEFYANPNHGRCIANGFAAYEWNQNSGPNVYQANIEGLTTNILNYLKY